jgi:Xaa-Pro dipeptidase
MKALGIVEKVKTAVRDSTYDGVVVIGPDNVQYIAGTALPFLHSNPDQYVVIFWPRSGPPVCICPVKWETTIRSQIWIEEVQAYAETMPTTEAAVGAVAHHVREALKTDAWLGVDMDRVSYDFFIELQSQLPGMRLTECDGWLNQLRMTKTPQEQQMLVQIALRTDHGILGAAHHLSVRNAQSEKRLAEEIRVHCLERQLDVVGHHAVSQVASGAHAQRFWPLAPKYGLGWDKLPREGELVRLEMRATLDGYWSDAARMLTVGEPSLAQRQAYEALESLRETAVQHLRPGVKCSEVFSLVKQEAERQDIELISDMGVGHGVGVAPYERPFLSESDDTELKAGMVLVLDPIIHGPEREIMRSRDTVLITKTGCEVVGWYKDWREPYITVYTF